MTPPGAPAPEWTPRSPLYRLGGSGRLLDVVTATGMLGTLRAVRRDAVDSLGLEPGMRVLDLACGTGHDLPALGRRVGDTGLVVAVDASHRLTAAARRRVARAGVAASTRVVTATWPHTGLGSDFDAAICCLGFSVIERWKAGLDDFVGSVRPGGRVAVIDWLVGVEHPRVVGRVVNAYVRVGSWLAQADPTRPLADTVASSLDHFARRRSRIGLELLVGTRP